MKKSNLFHILAWLVIPVLLNSCFSDPGTDIKLTSVSNVEISEATTSAGLDVSKSYDKIPGGPVDIKDSIRVNLVGAQRASATNVSFTIDPTSTAVAGLHYDMISQASISIPAKSSFGYIYFTVHPQVLNPGEVFKLKINLTTADVPVSVNFGKFTRSIRISCPFLRASFLGAYKCLEPSYGTYDVNISADAVDPFTVINSNFWDAGASIKYVFTANGSVSIPLQTFTAGATYTVQSQTGTSYDACIGKFIVPYIVKNATTGATVDINTHTFTKP
ncbi:MAG: hypothetical protein HOP30_20605 [Cyclobacteriaceae bacterium]|nr:hypothetical protein [Cyclobacteriaceae bacterium]